MGRSRKEHINGESVRYEDRRGGFGSRERDGAPIGVGVLLRVGAGELLRAIREGVMLRNSEHEFTGRSRGLRLQVTCV